MPLMNFTQECDCHRFDSKSERKTMAEKINRLPENIAGTYYIDSSCIDCDMCRSTAPNFFRRNEEVGMSVVYHQPVTPAEFALAEDAKQGCPTESIGNDGVTEATVSKDS
jgi:ferredoxin